MKPHPQFERLGFTPKQIQASRRYAARANMRLALAIESGKLQFAAHVTPQQAKAKADDNRARAGEIIAGKADNNFTVWQRMNYALTGACTALLPKTRVAPHGAGVS